MSSAAPSPLLIEVPERLDGPRVDLVTDELNTASRRVAERCGFTLEGVYRQVQRAPDGSLRSNCIYALLSADQLT